jgi:hypothetical protein
MLPIFINAILLDLDPAESHVPSLPLIKQMKQGKEKEFIGPFRTFTAKTGQNRRFLADLQQ